MEEKVQYVLSLIQEDGDSFAKRAEKYYKSRPELISFVEDSYHAFIALAERYDHVSTELQNANHTLATCFPEQYQLPTDEDDEYGTNKPPRIPPDISVSSNASNVPKDPKALAEHLKGLVQKRSKGLEGKNPSKDDDSGTRAVAKSCLSKTEAIAEIDRLHKDIVVLQTVKEYIKGGLEKYSSIENTILEKQQKICNLQDEFDIDKVMEDDDQARRLMAEATLMSCHENLTELQETHQKSIKEAKEERENVEDASHRLKHIKDQYPNDQTVSEENTIYENNDSITKTEEVTLNLCIDLDEAIQRKINQQFDISSMSSIPVTKLAEKIDKLVNEVIRLQSSVSSQTALIDRLRSESHELRDHIRTLENDKATLTEGTHDLRRKVKELQEKLDGVQHLNKNVKRLNSKLEPRFNETQSSLGNISDKLSHVKSAKISTQEKRRPREESKTQEEKETSAMSKTVKADAKYSNRREQNDDLHWPVMLLNGVEDKEKFLLKEYTTILKYYKDLRRKLNAVENKERNDHAEQITELRVAIAKRDEEIQHLRCKLIYLQRKFADTTDSNADELSASSLSDDKKIEDMTLEGDNYFNFTLSDHNTTISPIEEKLRRDIDTILDQNLDFWLRFSMSFHQIQKFKTSVKDLQRQICQIRYRTKQQENKVTISIKSKIRPIYKHMKKIKTELTAWLKQSVQLKDEVEHRFSSLCNVQEKISLALKEGAGEEIKFRSHQAAKFQGEILNMRQENKKVTEKLQAGVDHITSIQVEVDRTLKKLDDEFGQSSGHQNAGQANTRAKIEFRKLIFGSKRKKQSNNFMLSAFAS